MSVRGGYSTLLDDEDFKYYDQWKWGLHKDGYVIRTGWDKINKKSFVIFLHRLINETPKGFETDHINRDKLDNRKDNLRTVSLRENKYNIGLKSNNTSGITGVCWAKASNKWRVRVGGNKYGKHIGYYESIEDAIMARNKAMHERLG